MYNYVQFHRTQPENINQIMVRKYNNLHHYILLERKANL